MDGSKEATWMAFKWLCSIKAESAYMRVGAINVLDVGSSNLPLHPAPALSHPVDLRMEPGPCFCRSLMHFPPCCPFEARPMRHTGPLLLLLTSVLPTLSCRQPMWQLGQLTAATSVASLWRGLAGTAASTCWVTPSLRSCSQTAQWWVTARGCMGLHGGSKGMHE